jgi:hypothetical protein
MNLRTALAIVSAAAVLSAHPCIPASLADDGARVFLRQLMVTDSTGRPVGRVVDAAGGSPGVVIEIDGFWTWATVSRTSLAWPSGLNSLQHTETKCTGQPYIPVTFPAGSLFTNVVTIGPSWSAFVPDPRAPVGEITIRSERRADGTCVDYPVPHTAGGQTKAMFVLDLRYIPPFALRHLP